MPPRARTSPRHRARTCSPRNSAPATRELRERLAAPGQVHRTQVPSGQRPCPRGQPAVQLLRRSRPRPPAPASSSADLAEPHRRGVSWPVRGAMARAMQAGAPGEPFLGVGGALARRPALMPSQRSGSGSQRRERWPTHGSRTRSVSRPSTRSAQGAAGQVGGADAVADVPAGPGQPGRRVEPDRGAPVARHAERPAPGVRDAVRRRAPGTGRPASPCSRREDRGRRGRTSARIREPKWYGAPRPPKTSRSSAVRWP